ncbi:MAG TPA: DUF427 domain-containing protein [Candidatus Binatia bacterium]|jgi:uncharacterized protein (DUF427 family)
MKATWEDTVLAESDRTIVIEGHHYFPPDSIKRQYFAPSDMRTTCQWKGIASYYHVQVGDKSNADAAWYYPEPKEAVRSIKNHVAFWRGVKVSE